MYYSKRFITLFFLIICGLFLISGVTSAEQDDDCDAQSKKLDVIFVLDESGSISTADYNRMKNVVTNLVNKLYDEDRIAIFTFDHRVKQRSGFVDKNSAAFIISGLSQSGGSTALYNAIRDANGEFITSSSSDVVKIMICLTDGEDNSSRSSASSAIQTAKANNITIHMIGVGSVNTRVLTEIASGTGGSYFSAENFSQLGDIFGSGPACN